MALGGVIRWFTEVDPTPGIAGAKATADGVEHEVNRIDRMRAVVQLGAEKRELDRKINDAKDELHALSAMHSDPNVGLDDAAFKAGVARVEAKIATLSRQRANIRVNTSEIKSAVTQTNNLTAAETKQAAQISKLRQERAKAFTEMKKADDMDLGRTHREGLEIDRLRTHMAHLDSQIHDLGGSTDDLNVRLDKNNFSFKRLGDRIGNTRVRLGPLSMSMHALGAVSVILGPAILSVAGSLGALVGVAGTSLLGALAAGGAAMAGFGLSALGAVLAIKQMPEVAKQASDGMNRLQSRFARLTSGARKPVGEALAEGFKTANALLPIFAHEVTQTMNVAAAGTEKWMKGLRSPEAKQALSDIMGNFRKALPSLMDGLGHVGAILGRVMQSASKFLPSLTGGFEQWAQNLENSIGSGDALDQKISRLIGHMRSLGHFAQAGGSALGTFFNLGANSGEDLLNAMTRSLTRWQHAMQMDPSGTQNFFQQSVDTMKQLGPALGRALMTLVNLAEAFAPLAEEASAVFNTIATLAAMIPGPVWRAVGAFIALRKAMGFVSALTGLNLALGGTAAAAGQAGRAGVVASAAFSVIEAGAVGVVGATGAMGAAILAASIIIGRSQTPVDNYQNVLTDLPPVQHRVTQSVRDMASAQKGSAAAWAEANRLARQGKTDTEAFRQAVRKGNEEDLRGADAAKEHTSAVSDQRDLVKAAKRSVTDLTDAQRVANVAESQHAAVLKGSMPQVAEANVETDRLAGAYGTLHLAQLNLRRTMSGLNPIAQQQADLFQRLRAVFGKKFTVGVGIKSDPKTAQSIARTSLQLRTLGRTKAVAKIMADTGSAESKLFRLNQLRDKLMKPRPPMKIDADPTSANAALHSVERNKPKDKSFRIKAQDNASPALRSINAELNRLHDKTFTVTEVHKMIGKTFATGGIQAAFPTGGVTQRMLDHSSERAALRPVRNAGPGREVNSPTFLTGDRPGDTEWIVTDNPAFRRSNTSFLGDAAAALGFTLIPAFASGGSHKKANKQARKQTARANRGLASGGPAGGLVQQWDDMVALQEYWSDEYDLDRRSYDSGIGTGGIEGGFGLSDLLADLGMEINAYKVMLSLIPALSKLNKLPDVHVPSGAKGKAKGRATAAKGRVDAFNSAVDAAKGDVKDMDARTLNHLIRGLELEQLEIQQAQSTNALLGTSQAQTQMFSALQQFGSNIGGIGGGAHAPGAAAMPPLTPPTVGFATPSRSADPSFSAPSAAPTSDSGAHQSPGAGGVRLIQHFQRPPDDPMTWSKAAAFELGAI